MASNRIRFGMIGGGQNAFIGNVHRHAALMDGHYELVCGAFSRDQDNNTHTAQQLNVSISRTYPSWQTLLEQEAQMPEHERMQVLVIVTPNQLHVPISIAAIQKGFHVFCEKPAAVSLQEALSLQNVVATSPQLYGLAHTYLGYPMVWQARHMVTQGDIGTVRKVYVEYPQGWLSKLEEAHNKQAAWRTDPKQSGESGCMGDIGTHAFGLAEFVSGVKVTHVCADMNIMVAGRALDDDGAALLRFENEVSGVLIASQVCAGEENALSIRIYGDKGGIEWRQMEPNSVIHRPIDDVYRVYRAGAGQPGLCTEANARCRLPAGHPEGYLEAMANLYTHFALALRQNETGKASGVPGIHSGVRGMAFIQSMLASAKSETKWTPIVVNPQ